jgi:hypothetical protein
MCKAFKHEPTTYEEAVEDSRWMAAMQEEYELIIKNTPRRVAASTQRKISYH